MTSTDLKGDPSEDPCEADKWRLTSHKRVLASPSPCHDMLCCRVKILHQLKIMGNSLFPFGTIDCFIQDIFIHRCAQVQPLCSPLSYKTEGSRLFPVHQIHLSLVLSTFPSSALRTFGESRCLRSVALREILLGIAGN